MTTWTITVEPTVAPSTFSKSYEASVSTTDPGAKVPADQAYYNKSIGNTSYNEVYQIEADAETRYSYHSVSRATITAYSWPSFTFNTDEQTGESFDAWQVLGGGPGNLSLDVNIKKTFSWDGKMSQLIDGTFFTQNDTALFTRYFNTTTLTYENSEITVSTTQTTRVKAYQVSETDIVTTTSSAKTTVGTSSDITIESTAITTASETLVAYNGTTGNRGKATVVLLGPNEAAWVPTAYGFGNNLSEFASFVTQSQFTVTSAIIGGGNGITAELSADALYESTEVERTIVGPGLATTTITLTPSGAIQIPSTTTAEVPTVAVTSTIEVATMEKSNANTPKVYRATWQTTTMPAGLGATTWPITFYRSFSSFTTNEASVSVGSTSGSTTAVVVSDWGEYASDISDGSGTSSAKFEAKATFNELINPLIGQLPINYAFVTASSFYQARAALPSLTDVARDAYAQGITFQAASQCLAAQTAVAQFPTSWSYASESSSVTISADAGGVTQIRDSGGKSQTTKSGQWQTAGNAHLTQASTTMLNPVLNAATGSASLFQLPGTVFVTGLSSSWTQEKVGTAVLSELPSERQAVSYAPIYAVGDGDFCLPWQRNFSEFPIPAAFIG